MSLPTTDSFKERPVPEFDAGYGSKITADAKSERSKTRMIQSLVSSPPGGRVIEASRVCAGRVRCFWEVSGTEGTIYNNGERFNELQVFRMGEEKRDRGFKLLLWFLFHNTPLLALILPAVALATST
jgi:hypothetical protein